jgi:hypothetical protein
MARHALSRPPGPVERQSPPPHDRWALDRLTGVLSLRLEIPPGQYVSPGTGRLALTAAGTAGEVVAQQAARAAGTPVLPGSGIKGAVRTLYELLSSSCDPFRRGGADRCTPASCCAACALFGLLSYTGRVGFSDAVPASAGGARVEVQKVPVPWTPDAAHTAGEFRLYDLAAALPPKDRRAAASPPKKLSREVFLGTFETRMTFTNLTPEELGQLLLAMGLGTDRSTRFLLRLGGVKYDGKGAVKVVPYRLRLAGPRSRVLEGERCGEECVGWIGAAHKSPWATVFWPQLEALARVLQPPT